MGSTAVALKNDAGLVLPLLIEARKQVEKGTKEIVLDFSSVCRIDTTALRALEDFIRMADEKSVKLTLRAVDVEVYKVLKLQKLAGRVSYERS
jgi:anti-anti-sigma regulatory factor